MRLRVRARVGVQALSDALNAFEGEAPEPVRWRSVVPAAHCMSCCCCCSWPGWSWSCRQWIPTATRASRSRCGCALWEDREWPQLPLQEASSALLRAGFRLGGGSESNGTAPMQVWYASARARARCFRCSWSGYVCVRVRAFKSYSGRAAAHHAVELDRNDGDVGHRRCHSGLYCAVRGAAAGAMRVRTGGTTRARRGRFGPAGDALTGTAHGVQFTYARRLASGALTQIHLMVVAADTTWDPSADGMAASIACAFSHPHPICVGLCHVNVPCVHLNFQICAVRERRARVLPCGRPEWRMVAGVQLYMVR